MNWLFYTLSSIFFFTLLSVFQRKLAINSQNQRAMAVIYNLAAIGISLGLFFVGGSYKKFSLPQEITAWIALLIAAFSFGMVERGRFVVAKLLDVSVLSTIINFSVLIAFVGSVLLYKEQLTIQKILGGLLIVTALFLVSTGKRRVELSFKGILLAVFISIMLGIAVMLDKMGTRYFNANTYNIFAWCAPLLFIVFPGIDIKIIKKELRIASWKVFVLAGFNVFGYLFQLKALELSEATKIIPIIQTSTLFTVLAGILFLKERENVPRKLIAGVIAVVGVFLLV